MMDCRVKPGSDWVKTSGKRTKVCTRKPAGRRVSTRSGHGQQRDVPYVLVDHVQENRGRRVVTDQRRDVDDALMPKQPHGAGEGFRIDFVFADCIASELDNDP